MPRTPLAPREATVFSGVPVEEQSRGTRAAYSVAPITWMGSEAADSPPICKLAILIGPHPYALANMAHSAMTLPSESVIGGRLNEDDRTEEMIRNPMDPVSTRT